MKDCSLSKCEETEWVRGSWLLSALWGRSDLFPRWDLNFRYTCSRVVVLSKCKLCYIHCATYTVLHTHAGRSVQLYAQRLQCAAVCSESSQCTPISIPRFAAHPLFGCCCTWQSQQHLHTENTTCVTYKAGSVDCLVKEAPLRHSTCFPNICRVGQNRVYTPYMIVYLVIIPPKIPFNNTVYTP